MGNYKNRSGRRLRHSPPPDPMFLGGLFKGIGKAIGGIGKGIFEGVKGIGDFGLSAVGLPNIIDNSFVDKSKFLSGLTGITGSLAPLAANFIPGLGPLAGAGLRALQGSGIGGGPGQFAGGQQLPQMGGGQFGGMFGGGQQGGGQFGGLPMGFNMFGSLMSGFGNQFQGGNPFSGGGMFGGGQSSGGLNIPGLTQPPQGGGIGAVLGLPQGGFGSGFTPGFTGLNTNQAPFRFFKKGGVAKYQTGGQVMPQLVDIQAEKGELILHPTGMLTDVHARKTHGKMTKDGEDDIITDHPLEESFIFSDFLKLKKSDADDLIVGVKRYPYSETKKGKEPEVFSVGDIFRKGERKLTPAKLAKRIKKRFQVTEDDKDIFNIFGDKQNFQNRLPYLQGISALSEIERQADDLREEAKEATSMIFAKKGGKMRSRRVHKAQVGFDPFQSPMATGNMGFGFGINPFMPGNVFQPQVPQSTTSNFLGQNDPFSGVGSFNPQFDLGPINLSGNTPVSPLGGDPPSGPHFQILDPLSVSGNPAVQDPIMDALMTQAGVSQPSNPLFGTSVGANNPALQQDPAQVALQQAFNQVGQQAGPQQFITNFENVGNPILRGIGQGAAFAGGLGSVATNIAGGIGARNLFGDFIDEASPFFQGQRDLVNQSRDIASQGNLFDIGLGLLRQGPEDLPINQATRLKQFDPQRGFNMRRQLANQSLGQINSMIRGNQPLRGDAIGAAIAQNNQSLANAFDASQQQQFGIDTALDDIDFQNANILAGNRQRRTDFGNQLINDTRGGFRGFFGNEASRPLDMLGLNNAERQTLMNLRQQQLFVPNQFFNSAAQGLSNLGSSLFAMNNQFIPVQTPVANPNAQQGPSFGQQLLGALPSILGQII